MTQPGIRLEASRGDLFGESRTQKYKTGFIILKDRTLDRLGRVLAHQKSRLSYTPLKRVREFSEGRIRNKLSARE